MKILIAGLGLIGASLAKTIKKNTNHYVMGWNRTQSVSEKALEDGAVDEIGELCKINNRVFLVDAMSSYGGIPIDFEKNNIAFLVRS